MTKTLNCPECPGEINGHERAVLERDGDNNDNNRTHHVVCNGA